MLASFIAGLIATAILILPPWSWGDLHGFEVYRCTAYVFTSAFAVASFAPQIARFQQQARKQQ